MAWNLGMPWEILCSNKGAPESWILWRMNLMKNFLGDSYVERLTNTISWGIASNDSWLFNTVIEKYFVILYFCVFQIRPILLLQICDMNMLNHTYLPYWLVVTQHTNNTKHNLEFCNIQYWNASASDPSLAFVIQVLNLLEYRITVLF